MGEPTVMPREKRGRELLRDFLSRHSIKRQDLAEALGVTPSAVTYWLSDDPNTRETPRALIRRAIAKYTNGEVPEEAWSSDDEAEFLDRVQPFRPADPTPEPR